METLRIIGVDPATTNLGLSIIDTVDGVITNIITHEIIIPKDTGSTVTSDPLHTKLKLVNEMIYTHCIAYHPHVASIETPFIDRFRPTSAIPLSRTLQTITEAFRMYNPYIYINMISPSTVKNSVGAKGGTNKIAVNEAILKIDELQGYVDLENISEHEVDAVAIAYNLLLQIRMQPTLIYN